MDEKHRLIYPSDFVVKVVKFAENVLNCELKEENWLKNIFAIFVMSICKLVWKYL